MNVATIEQLPSQPPKSKPAAKSKWLSQATNGKQETPPRVLIYGEEKVGKSTFAAGAPATAYLSYDNGTSTLNVSGRLPTPETISELYELLAELEAGPQVHGFQTLVIDPINWLEDRMLLEMLNEQPGKTLNNWGGGYGAGIRELRRRWREMLGRVERVWKAGLGVVFVAHRALVDFKDPEGADYKRFVPALRDEENRGAIKAWCDVVLHAQCEAFGVAVDGKTKAGGSGDRFIRTVWTPAADGGNRWGLPEELPLSWQALTKARTHSAAGEKAVLAKIEQHLKTLGDAKLERTVRTQLASGRPPLEVEQKLAARIENKKNNEANQ